MQRNPATFLTGLILIFSWANLATLDAQVKAGISGAEIRQGGL